MQSTFWPHACALVFRILYSQPSTPQQPYPCRCRQVLIITNPAAVTVPGRILKALLGDYAAASATQVQTAVGAAAAAAAQLSASPIEAGGSGCELPADVIVSAASRCADEPLSGGAVSPVAATRLASPQPCTAQRTEPPATSPSVAGTANKGHLHQTPLETLNPAVAAMLATLQDNVLQIDVALRINGKVCFIDVDAVLKYWLHSGWYRTSGGAVASRFPS